MWSDNYKKDMWWIESGDNYFGPFEKREQAERFDQPFEITQHEWSDEAKDCHVLFNNPSWVGNDLQIEIVDQNGNYADAVLIKEHAIAIAKHFKLTVEDLK